MTGPVLDMAMALHSLGAARPDILIAAANEVVDGGTVTPYAASLSMMTPAPGADAESEFERMLVELGLSLPSQELAARTVLRGRLTQMVDGKLDPLEGLRLLGDEIGLGGSGPFVPRDASKIALRIHFYCETCDPTVAKPEVRREVDAATIEVAREWLSANGA